MRLGKPSLTGFPDVIFFCPEHLSLYKFSMVKYNKRTGSFPFGGDDKETKDQRGGE